MSDSSKAFQWYEANAREVADRHEALDPEKVHHWWLDQLPNSPAVILDVGAGSGRDAAWLAAKNHDVIAVEPVTAMIQEGLRRRPNPNFRWMEDELPSLQKISRLGISFDLVLLSAVWMHVKPADCNRAFRKVIQLLKPGGALVMTFRQSPAPPKTPAACMPSDVKRSRSSPGTTVPLS
jgi:SAM-dependent methyltransferase